MMLTALIILVLVGVGSMATFAGLRIETSLSSVDILLAIMSAWPIIVAFMMISLFLGSCLPTRRLAAMTATVIFVASYFGERFTILAKSLRPLSRWSLFHYFDATSSLFSDGVKARDLGVLLATVSGFFVLAVVCFARRDVTTAAWPWRRNNSTQHQSS